MPAIVPWYASLRLFGAFRPAGRASGGTPSMNIEVSRRHFMKLAGAGAAGSAIAAFGFSEAEAQLAAHVRPFKLVQTREARTICPYCAVSCGMLLFAKPSPASNGKLEVTHIEGDS